MNWPTILIATLIAGIFLAIVLRGIYNRKHNQGGCSGCSGGCAGCTGCGSARSNERS